MNPATINISFESPDMELLESRKKLGVGFTTLKTHNFFKNSSVPFNDTDSFIFITVPRDTIQAFLKS